MTVRKVWVPGVPRPKGSPAILRHRGTGRPFVRESKTVIGWERAIRDHAARVSRELMPRGVAIRLDFMLPRVKRLPKSVSGYLPAAKKPDLDKLCRAVLDALTGVWLEDDSHVVILEAGKRVATIQGEAGVQIEAWEFLT